MAKKKVEEPEGLLISENPDIPKPRLVKLIVKNFRCIGTTPVEIDLNDIVVLVGANNVGKSSILKAYEVVMSHGSNNAKLKLEDFPNNKIDSNHLPEIVIQTIVYDNSPGNKWITTLPNGEMLIRERWIWANEGEPKREGWDVENNGWSDNVPWGAPNVAKSRRPEPHRVNVFDDPLKQAEAIKSLLTNILNERVKSLKSIDGEENDYSQLINQIKRIQKKVVIDAQTQIDLVNSELTSIIEKIFPNHIIDFDAKPEDNLDGTINFFKSGAQLLMGPKDGYLSTVDRQGSGARRTLLWTALKYISEYPSKLKVDEGLIRPHLLLMDEPEICLHPNAIRDASNVLYGLPQKGNWQIMVTTHSPIFIDFSRDNTTIVRVEKNVEGDIQGTTVFRPDKIQLSDDDKKNLKLLNLCDPYVAEFFFGGRTIIVEGDTEYTAMKYIISQKPETYKDVHIIRARGKATIVSLIKILNQFGSHYSVLHDSDLPTIMTKKGEQINSAWTLNQKILDSINAKPSWTKVRLLASIPNFEKAYFGQEVENEKPYNALKSIETDELKFKVIESLLNALIDHQALIPKNCIEWNSLEQLSQGLNNS